MSSSYLNVGYKETLEDLQKVWRSFDPDRFNRVQDGVDHWRDSKDIRTGLGHFICPR